MSLADKSALVLGAGGLGCPAAVGLAAAGVGRITLVDPDVVDPTNLARQMLYGDADVGAPKVAAAARALAARFPGVRVTPLSARFAPDAGGRALVGEHDVVLDGTDDFPTRFAANDLCLAARVPLVHGAAIRWLGHLMVVRPGGTACLRCVFEGPPPEGAPACGEAGVVSPLVGVVGGWMAEAAVEILAGRPPAPSGVRVLEALRGRTRFAAVERDPACAACAELW